MYWTIITYGFIPAGLLTCAFLMSNQPMLLSAGSAVANMQIKFALGTYGTIRMPFSIFVSAFAVISAITQFSQVQHYSSLITNVDLPNTPTQINDRYRSMNFRAERNFWVSMFWLVSWITCWRLSDLKSKHALTAYAPPPSTTRGGGKLFGLTTAVIGGILLCMADLPVARVNYNFMVSQNITPEKERLQSMMLTDCQASYFATAEGQCREFCQQVRYLADERLRIVTWVRSWHFTGTFAAQVFDGFRGVQQSQDRISELFSQKPCMQVLNSVDRTNVWVNAGCWIALALCIFVGLALLFANEGSRVPVPPQPQADKKVD
eukprot:GEMP01041031.1.p1 GENE.GEMP01041031.1~~GEMP01041031.1.p1  ORF type:complete len:320 (+),score=35.07 GEMP01041031.1:53-1012(+)